jgi:hypothetical protein
MCLQSAAICHAFRLHTSVRVPGLFTSSTQTYKKTKRYLFAEINILLWDFMFSMQWLWSILWHCAEKCLYCTAESHTPNYNSLKYTTTLPNWQHWKVNLNLWESKSRIKKSSYVCFKFEGAKNGRQHKKRKQAIHLVYPLSKNLLLIQHHIQNLTDSNARFKQLYLMQ